MNEHRMPDTAYGHVRNTVGGRPLMAISVALGVGFLLSRTGSRR
jgi:hypothetical protein